MGQEWKEAWIRLRGRARKACRERVAHLGGTGGGPPPDVLGLGLSKLYESVLDLTGLQAAVGTDCPDVLSVQLRLQKAKGKEQDFKTVVAANLTESSTKKKEEDDLQAALAASLTVSSTKAKEDEDLQAAMAASLTESSTQKKEDEDLQAALAASLTEDPCHLVYNFETAVESSIAETPHQTKKCLRIVPKKLELHCDMEDNLSPADVLCGNTLLMKQMMKVLPILCTKKKT